MSIIHWKSLEIGKTYYTKRMHNSFGLPNDYRKITITDIWHLPNDEAMLYVVDDGKNRGLAVGGIFEDYPLGSRHRFWLEDPTYIPNNSQVILCAAGA